MYQDFHQFHTPDRNTTVWRYIDFTKFADFLTSQQLFFCRSDKFEDPFEGLFILKDSEKTEMMFKSQPETKKYYFLNCWHINEHQSDAMWKIFANTKNGIAIKSSVGSIIDSMHKTKEGVYIGKIYYRDLANMTYNELLQEEQNQISTNHSSINQFNYKRISFEHERELRLYHIDLPIPHATKDGDSRAPLEYKKITVDIKTLVNEIVIAPFADEWFVDLTKNLISQLQFDFKVSKSNLYSI